MPLWQIESSAAINQLRGGAPAWLPAGDRPRWERLKAARQLYEGDHRRFFLIDARTQFDYPVMRVGEFQIQPYITFNLLRLISLKTADLLFGSKAKLDAPTIQQSDKIDQLARKSLLHSRFHGASVQASWAGGAFLESLLWRGEPFVDLVQADEIYPQGTINPDGQYDSYVRYATAQVGPQEKPITLLLITTYAPGLIQRRLWQLDDSGQPARALSLDQWPPYAAAGREIPPPDQASGLNENTITYLPNQLGDRSECSDYDGLIELQDTVNAKYAQVARVLAKHADPKLAAPESTADAKGNLSALYDVFFFRSRDEIPSYITWSAELDAAMRDRDAAVDALCTAAEMSQVLLGIKRGGATPDAARKLRLEATNSLAKVGRKALVMETAIARAVEVTQKLDQTSSLLRLYPVDAIGVEMRDGLPTDPLDDAQEISLLRGARVMSIENAVERRMEDPDAAAVEVQRIREEDAAATPSSFFGGMNGIEPGESTSDAPGAESSAGGESTGAGAGAGTGASAGEGRAAA